MQDHQDHNDKFVKFYSDLINNYEKTINKQICTIVLLGSGFITVTALLILFLSIHYL